MLLHYWSTSHVCQILLFFNKGYSYPPFLLESPDKSLSLLNKWMTPSEIT